MKATIVNSGEKARKGSSSHQEVKDTKIYPLDYKYVSYTSKTGEIGPIQIYGTLDCTVDEFCQSVIADDIFVAGKALPK